MAGFHECLGNCFHVEGLKVFPHRADTMKAWEIDFLWQDGVWKRTEVIDQSDLARIFLSIFFFVSLH